MAVEDFLASRGMGVAQGKKVWRRRWRTADRGEAGLRSDQANRDRIGAGHTVRTRQGEVAGSRTKWGSGR